MKKILIYTGSRADYGILKSLILECKKKKKIQTKIYVGGVHFSKNFGETFKEIIKDKIKVDFSSKVQIKKTGNLDILNFMSESLKEYTGILNIHKPDLIVVLGDRYETYTFVIAAFFLNIRIVHIHGGEVTEGAFDDALRHSISKLSDYHFVTHKSYKKRLIQLGEKKQNIFLVGSLGVQNFISSTKVSKAKLFKKYKIPLNKKIILVTFHPETKGKINIKDQIRILISALGFIKNVFFIFTYNNMDTYGSYFIKNVKSFKQKYKNCLIFKSMGTNLYYNFISNVDLVLGNSSSGIIEAPAAKTPTLDIGSRQFGRIKSSSIFSCDLNIKKIIGSIKIILKKNKFFYKNIYYKKETKQLIVNNLLKILKQNKIEPKKFYDIKF